jgi:DNA-binding response OmpR family regulator
VPCEILVVEDNLDDLHLFEHALDAAKFDYRLQHNPGGTTAAFEIASLLHARLKPSLLVLDYHLPGWTAPELLQVLQAERLLSNVEVMVLAGAIPSDSTTALYGLGARKVIEKPFDWDGFLQLGVQVRDWCLSRGA